MPKDSALLHAYAQTHAEDAFAELVRRHVDLVYSVALRQVGGDAHLAHDVAQTVFTALARKARALAGREVISGWLYRSTHYAASDAVRAERRRRTREQEAHVMQEITTTSEPAPDLEKLRPLLDAAIGELGEVDRDAVCLRFFEDRSYAEIGARLRLSENSARMRVERALDKLHALLARRGVTSTTAALALALPGQAATPAPLGLAATLTHTALITSTGLTAGWTMLTLMNTPKIALGTAAVISAVALGTALHLRNDARNELVAARETHAAAVARITELEGQLAVQTRIASEAEAANAALVGAVERATTQLAATPKPTTELITKDSVDARYTRAKELNKAGHLEEALAEYLWCFDTGMPKVTSYSGVRLSGLISDIAKLGDRLPAALQALQARRETARQHFLTSTTGDFDAAHDFTSLSRVLKEEPEALALLDSLPPDGPHRKTLAPLVYEQLTAAQRYTEAAAAQPYALASMRFEMFANRIPNGRTPELSEQLKQAQRQMVIRRTATDIEVFAGVGDFEHAADLALRLLDYDSSPETIALLEKHATRAGHPNLVSTLRAK